MLNININGDEMQTENCLGRKRIYHVHSVSVLVESINVLFLIIAIRNVPNFELAMIPNSVAKVSLFFLCAGVSCSDSTLIVSTIVYSTLKISLQDTESHRIVFTVITHSCIPDKVFRDFHQCWQILLYIFLSDPWDR